MFRIPFSTLDSPKIIQLATEKLAGDSEDWEKNIWKFILTWLDNSVPVIRVYSSGSTGEPKEIIHSKSAVLNSARLSCDALQLHQGGKAFLCLPANKISGMMMIVRCIYNQMDLFYVRPSADPLITLTNQQKFNLSAFTPMQLFGIENNLVKFHHLENIQKVIIGGDEVPLRLAKSLRLMNNETFATFGMTETISHIALRRLNGKESVKHFTTLSGITVSSDERNCLVIKAPELGIEELVTRDVVRFISPTEFEWQGRIDNVINSGGVKIYPEKIEEQLMPFLHFPFFVTGIENERTGREVAIAMEKPSLTSAEAGRLKAQFEQLDKLYRPHAILCLSRFVKTENGKIKRQESLEMQVDKIEI